MTRLEALRRVGVSIWLDTLSRDLLDSGAFAAMIADDGVSGATSNPTIFAKGDRRLGSLRRAAQGCGRRRRPGPPRAVLRTRARGRPQGRRPPAANARVAYARYRDRFSGERWRRLSRAGARPQRPLWASTGTKDPAYPPLAVELVCDGAHVRLELGEQLPDAGGQACRGTRDEREGVVEGGAEGHRSQILREVRRIRVGAGKIGVAEPSRDEA
jgi:hypothetical protein